MTGTGLARKRRIESHRIAMISGQVKHGFCWIESNLNNGWNLFAWVSFGGVASVTLTPPMRSFDDLFHAGFFWFLRGSGSGSGSGRKRNCTDRRM